MTRAPGVITCTEQVNVVCIVYPLEGHLLRTAGLACRRRIMPRFDQALVGIVGILRLLALGVGTREHVVIAVVGVSHRARGPRLLQLRLSVRL